jgi:hypothetical protein
VYHPGRQGARRPLYLGTSSRNTVPRNSRVKRSISSCLSKHHQDEFNGVVVANNKGVSLATFTVKLQEPRVRTLLVNSSVRESVDNSPVTADATPSAGNTAGASLHEDSMARRSTLKSLFVDTDTEQAGAPGKQRSMPDVFKPSSSWTDKKDKQWKEELASCVAEQYLPMPIVDVHLMISPP